MFERKVAACNTKASKSKSKGPSPADQTINYPPHPPTTWIQSTPQDGSSMPMSAATDSPSAEIWIVNETSGSLLSPASLSPMSEPSTWSPNETPPYTPRDATSATSLTSESDSWTSSKNSKLTAIPTLATATACKETRTATDETGPTHLAARDAPATPTTQAEVSNPASAESSGLSKDSGESVTCRIPIETNTTNSSTDSCKTPVAPLNEVVITMEDDEELKLVLVSSNECSSGEILYTSGNSVTKDSMDVIGNVSGRDNDGKSLVGSEYESSSGELIYSSEHTKMNSMTDVDQTVTSCEVPCAGEPPLPPSPIAPPKASTELRRGKHSSAIQSDLNSSRNKTRQTQSVTRSMLRKRSNDTSYPIKIFKNEIALNAREKCARPRFHVPMALFRLAFPCVELRMLPLLYLELISKTAFFTIRKRLTTTVTTVKIMSLWYKMWFTASDIESSHCLTMEIQCGVIKITTRSWVSCKFFKTRQPRSCLIYHQEVHQPRH